MALLEIDRLKVPMTSGTGTMDFDFSLDPGKNCCIYSDDGKMLSSLFDIIAGFTSGFEGRIFLAGRSVGGLNLADRGISACGLDVGIYDHLTVAGNLAVPAGNRAEKDITLRGLVEKSLWNFRLDGIAGLYPEELTDREKILLSMAKAVIADPVIVVCNLTGSIPSGFQGFDLANEIKHHAERLALTIIIFTSDAFTALNISEEIVIIGDSGVIQRGSPKDLVTSPEYIDVAKAFAIPGLNIFSGTVTEEQPFMFVENVNGFFGLPGRMKEYFKSRLGSSQLMGVRPEAIQLVHPDETKTSEKNHITIKRIDHIGLGVFAYFDFSDAEWCAFLPAEKVVYPGMKLSVYVPEDAWFFSDDEGKIMLDL